MLSKLCFLVFGSAELEDWAKESKIQEDKDLQALYPYIFKKIFYLIYIIYGQNLTSLKKSLSEVFCRIKLH